MELQSILPNEVGVAIGLLAVVVAVFHLLVGLILFQKVRAVSNILHTPHGRLIRMLGLVHILFLTGILVIILLN